MDTSDTDSSSSFGSSELTDSEVENLYDTDEESEGYIDGEHEVQGWLYEPQRRDNDEENREQIGDADSHEASGQIQPRIDNTDWCSCQRCVALPTSAECNCCRENPRFIKKMDELLERAGGCKYIGILCITEHPGFTSVCLDIDVLETAYNQYKQEHGVLSRSIKTHRRNRYIAYRQLVRWIWGYLGKHIRVPLPACTVKKIRETFPEPDDYQHTGYEELDILSL